MGEKKLKTVSTELAKGMSIPEICTFLLSRVFWK